jgi:hypothetical protein
MLTVYWYQNTKRRHDWGNYGIEVKGKGKAIPVTGRGGP